MPRPPRRVAMSGQVGAWLWVRLTTRADHGDVPGWAMVTLMTAGLVVAIYAVFRDAIVDAVRTALDEVVSGTGG
jgi:hypothetical protein